MYQKGDIQFYGENVRPLREETKKYKSIVYMTVFLTFVATTMIQCATFPNKVTPAVFVQKVSGV